MVGVNGGCQATCTFVKCNKRFALCGDSPEERDEEVDEIDLWELRERYLQE